MFVENFKAEIDAYAAHLMGGARLWKAAERGAISPDVIASYLYNLLFLLSRTEPHLALAEARASDMGRPMLSRFFHEKLLEEAGHGAWAEADLIRLRDAFGVERPPEPKPAMERLIRTLESAISEDPTSYIGYVTFSEYFTVIMGPSWIRMLSERCGIPEAMLSVIGNHVELDVEHAARGFDEMAQLIQADDESGVMNLLREVMRCLEAFYDELADGVASRELTHAA